VILISDAFFKFFPFYLRVRPNFAK
jgi:hypothetical protein